jgi:hypothetical protein
MNGVCPDTGAIVCASKNRRAVSKSIAAKTLDEDTVNAVAEKVAQGILKPTSRESINEDFMETSSSKTLTL